MSFPLPLSRMRRVFPILILGSTALLAAGTARAQAATEDQSSTRGYSSSQDGLSASGLQLTEFALPAAPEPDGSAGEGNGAGQYGNGGGGGGERHSLLHSWAFEAGGGFNAPESSSITYGGQFTLGGGLRFNKYLSGLIEYQFMDDKLPGGLIAETGATGGNAHMWSFTFDPVVDLTPKATNGVYVTGGGGFYRKVTSFTDPEEAEYCEYYGCGTIVENEVVGHFSSNQGGFNVGAGFEHRVGGGYGDSHTKLFVEARYVELFSPASVSNPNGLGTTAVAADTKMIPVSVGVRF
jgi:Outer membrane protein beta-barrel domain